jgi:adenine deaminase
LEDSLGGDLTGLCLGRYWGLPLVLRQFLPHSKGMQNFPRLTEAALGKIPCDLLIKNVKFFDVFSCRWVTGEVGIVDGFIVGVEPGLKAKKSVNGKGRKLVPGFIDAHVHIESSLMVPQDFQNVVLPRGTTTAVFVPHEITNVKGGEGL